MRATSNDDIVISGISGRYPKSNNLQEFWDNLVNSVEMYTDERKRWPGINLPESAGFLTCHDQFDNELFDYKEETCNLFDPQMRLFHETTYEALFDAGLDPFNVGGDRAACFMGSCYNDTHFERQDKTVFKSFSKPFYDHDLQNVCKTFNLKALSFNVDTACAASFSALHQAIQAFKTGEIDFAVIGGLAVQLRPFVTIGFANLRMLSPEGKSKSLDASVDGYCRSEAVVSIVLQKRKDAKRIYSSIYHSDTNCDGYKQEGITFPSTKAQYALMKRVYAESDLDPERYISYIEAHMTGTPVGDPVETHAIIKALRPNKSRPLIMGCLKSNLGHSEGASALVGISKAALIFQKNLIPPNINYNTPNPNIPYLKDGLAVPVLENIPFEEDFIPINAFGFGGVNVHAILKANEKRSESNDFKIFKSKYKLPQNWFSFRTLHDLKEFNKYSRQNEGQDLIRLVNLTNRTVEGCNYSIDFIEKNRSKINNDFLKLIEDVSFIDPVTKLNYHAFFTWSPDGKILSKRISKIDRKRPLYIVFSALGSQWVKMGVDLLQIEIFARKIVELNAFTCSKFKFNLIDFITQEMDESKMNSELIKSLLAISSIQMALIDLIRFLEVDVKGFIGHSVGEYAAAYADGCATSEQILEMIYILSSICEKHLEKGTMVSIGLSLKDCEARLPKDLYICCDNSVENVTIGGPTKSVDAFVRECEKNDIYTHKVQSCGQVFHSKKWIGKIYDQVLFEFNKIMGNKKLNRSSKWISTSIETDGVEPETLAIYLADNVIKKVNFRDVIHNLEDDICFLELGPHAQLLPLIKQEKGRNATCFGSSKYGEAGKNLNNFFVAIGELFNNGITTKISKLFSPVQYPVSRQTLSLSHLLRLDHSVPKFVFRYPEYHNRGSLSVKFEINFEEPKFKSWYGHVIDGRILLPATGYLSMAYEMMQKNIHAHTTRDFIISAEFHNVNFLRAIVLDKSLTTEVRVRVSEESGQFSIIDSSGQMCCNGFVKRIGNCDFEIDLSLYKPNKNERLEVIGKEDVYKELRVRGYDYQGDFQGIIEVNASGKEGKVKYKDSWTAFTDAMLQVSILGEKSRGLFVPTHIDHLICDGTKLTVFIQECAEKNIEPIFNVFYDKNTGVGVTNGMMIKGIKVAESTRRSEKQKATLNEYSFIPYEDSLKLTKDISKKLDKYHSTLEKLIDAYAKKVKHLEDVDLTRKELKDNFHEKELHSCLNLVVDVIETNYLAPEVKLDENGNEIIDDAKEEIQKLDLNETIKQRQEELSCDLIITNNHRLLLKNHIATIMENLNIKQVKLLEINFTSTLLMDHLTILISLISQARTDYSLMHPKPALKSISSKFGIKKVIEFKPENSSINSSEVEASNIVIYKHWSCGFVNSLESIDLNFYKLNEEQEKTLIKNIFNHITNGGFLIVCYRTKITLLEEKLMEFGRQNAYVEMANRNVLLNYLKEAGFEYIGEQIAENEAASCSILVRKVSKDLVKIEKNEEENSSFELENPLEPIPIEVKLFDYRWVAKVKKQLKTKSQKRIWLIARDSSFNGIIGMMKCLKKEPEGERIRCLFNIDDCKDEEFIENKIKNGLTDSNLIDDENETQFTKNKVDNEKGENGDLINLSSEKSTEKTKDEIEEEEETIDFDDKDSEELRKLISDDLINKDLSMNIIINGKLGSYHQTKLEEEILQNTEYAVLDIVTRGDLSSFRWFGSNMKEVLSNPSILYPSVVEYINQNDRFGLLLIDIYYSALNFKDVMVATGRVPKNAYPSCCSETNLIGMEYSGKLEDGKRIMGILPGSGISTKFVSVDKSSFFYVPDEWSLAQAATVPVVYLTAYYSLFIRGGLLPGEKVLIHAGSGGVGFAAISICLSRGCEVFTTVSTKEKKEFLQKHFPSLKDRNFANSRDIDFEEHIMKETNGYGVDIVLNSLAEEKLRASIRCLASHGRFLEIGKYDIISNNPIDTTALGENKTLHCICLAHLIAETYQDIEGSGTSKWNKTCELLKQGIKKGEVRPLNYTLFSKDECEKAFRYMANGKHMGKVLIEIRNEDDRELKQNIVKVIPKTWFKSTKSYILTGGLGGFGLELAFWMIQTGCRRLIITSRKGIKNTYQEMQVRKMREIGCNVVISNENCYTLESTQRLLDQASLLGELGGIFHLAMVLNDSIFMNQTDRLFRKVTKPKIDSTFFLDYLTRNIIKYNQLDYFICFSSVASAIGNPGQSNYAFANSAMERIVEKRTKDLHPLGSKCKNIAIQWGAIGDVGAFAERFGNEVVIAGMIPQRIISCLKTIDEVLNHNVPVLSSLVLEDESKLNALGGGRGSIINTIMHVLGISDPSTLDPNVTLNELGLDSLMAVEIKQGLEREYDIVMSTQDIRNLTYKRLQEMSEELENQKIKGENLSEEEKDHFAIINEIFNSKEELFIDLYDPTNQNAHPVFFLGPIEGDFMLIRKVCKYLGRPSKGIAWIEEFDDKTISEICAIMAQEIIKKYSNTEIDLIGYSFGTLICLELGSQLQASGSVTVRKLIFLDGSPDFCKNRYFELLNSLQLASTDLDTIMTTMLIRLTDHVIKVNNPEEIKSNLLKLPDINARVQSVVQLLEGKYNIKVEQESFMKQLKRMYNKARIVHQFDNDAKFNGDIYLIRASESSVAKNPSLQAYNIENICTGKTEFSILKGDHKTFISNNPNEVGQIIDGQTYYLSI